jgi:hypothetical protein
MKRARLLPRVAAAGLVLSSCGVYVPTEPAYRTTLKITVTQCDLGGSVELVIDGQAGPYPTLPTPGEITLEIGPGPHNLTYRRNNQEVGGNIGGDPLEVLRHLSSGETMRITTIDPPWACIAGPGARLSGVR